MVDKGRASAFLPTFTTIVGIMNWLDLLILALLALAAFKGFQRGFIVELLSLVALVAGIWVASRFSEKVTTALGIAIDHAALAFVITFLVVLLAVHVLARFLTTLIDLAQLGLPNKLAGVVFGMVRSAFSLSVVLNLLVGYTEGSMPPVDAREASALYAPVRGFAPLLVPALGETKWVQWAVEEVRNGLQGLPEEEGQ